MKYNHKGQLGPPIRLKVKLTNVQIRKGKTNNYLLANEEKNRLQLHRQVIQRLRLLIEE